MRDLLVVGGGPAGLATALHAARAGLDTEVWEPRLGTPGGVDKACGEGLMPGALTGLLDLGVDPPGHDFDGIRYLRGSTTAEACFAGAPGRGIRRTVLHDALLTAAQDAGVRLVGRAAHEVHQDDDGVVVDGERVRHLVAADGLHSPVRRALGLDAPARGRPRYGLRRHLAVAPWTTKVEVHWAPSVEAYVTPVAADVVGVAVLASRKGSFEDHLAELPALRERVLAAPPASTVRGAGPLRQGARRRAAGRVLLVGDASGYVDALTGEGLALGLAQAGAAVRAIADGEPERYDRDWHRLTRRYRWLTAALLAGTRPRPLRHALVPVARALPPVFGGAVRSMARPVG